MNPIQRLLDQLNALNPKCLTMGEGMMREIKLLVKEVRAHMLPIVIQPKEDYKFPNDPKPQVLKRNKYTVERYAMNQPDAEELGKVFINDVLLDHRDYIIIKHSA